MESHSSSNSVSSRPPYHSYLHSIKKPNMKPWKKPIAPLPPTPPKVYMVEPVNFRDLVQRLTGAPESSDRLHNLAPPPLDLAAPFQLLSSTSKKQTFSSLHQQLAAETNVNQRLSYGGLSDSVVVASSSLELNMSPSSYNWCSFPLLSPGTLSSLEQSTVL